jgi:hypothetical protein
MLSAKATRSIAFTFMMRSSSLTGGAIQSVRHALAGEIPVGGSELSDMKRTGVLWLL